MEIYEELQDVKRQLVHTNVSQYSNGENIEDDYYSLLPEWNKEYLDLN